MKQSLLRRVLSVLLCVSLLLGVSVVRPQKVEAFAISASLVASVIMIMTACGVTFWASTQGDAESYISGKLGEYLDTLNPVPESILDWLNIQSLVDLFTVINGGVVRFDSNVANPILDFVRWFYSDEVVESGGSDVVSYPDEWSGQPIPYSISNSLDDKYNFWYKAAVVNPSGSSGTFVTFSYNNSDGDVFVTAYNRNNSVCFLVGTSATSGVTTVRRCRGDLSNGIPGGSSATNPLDLNKTSGDCLYSDTPTFSIPVSDNLTVYCPYFTSKDDALAALVAVCSDGMTPTTVITPSPVVSVPDAISEDDNFAFSPSVTLTQGMSVDDATDLIMDGVTSNDGLSATDVAVDPPALDLSGILEILGSILNAILAIPGHIAALPSAISSAFSSLLTSIKSVLDSIEDWVASIAQTVLGLPAVIGQAAQDVITGIQSIPRMISDALVNLFVPDEAFIGEFVASLHGIFDNRFSILSYPFSILGEFITRASGIDQDEPILSWPSIYEPFSGKILIRSGFYNLNSIRQGKFAQAYDLYMVVVKGWISFEFLGYLYSWFCSVFKMREDDFISPLEAYDGGDDG